MERITSRQNAIVKRFRELARAAGGDAVGEMLLDGAHLVQEALATRRPDRRRGVRPTRARRTRSSPIGALAQDLATRGGRVARRHRSGARRDEPGAITRRASSRSRGAAVHVDCISQCVHRARRRPIRRSCSSWPTCRIRQRRRDRPGRRGRRRDRASSRSTASANPFGWKALRGAMGGTFRLPIAARGTLADVVASRRASACRLVATVPRGGTPLPRVDLPRADRDRARRRRRRASPSRRSMRPTSW